MKISNLTISNFRGVREVRFSNLGEMVVVAGQNGSGKSCIFDAIRLLKSVYGGYQANEWHHWMGEFQISLNSRSSDFKPIFNNPTLPLTISCDFALSEDEKQFITAHAEDLLREKIWKTILPEAYNWGGLHLARFAAQFREREPEVATRANHERPMLIRELSEPFIKGQLNIIPGEFPQVTNSIALAVIFSNFRPSELGVIDYHGAQRHYGRESVQGINLNLDATQQQRSQSALYNYANKYTNVKGEMAASYVKEILAEQAGVPRNQQSTLTNTLQELFQRFFPEKQFLGPIPTVAGLLTFPVQTLAGTTHDLDDLSAGEKEILYGYLRIRNSAPRYSIILLDEPELHLNPRLIRALPDFYKKHLGATLGNQIWLITHSDALLREVVARDGYNVFHMLPCGSTPSNQSQLKPLQANQDLELALIDLVGDLAAFRPGGKVVILEGGGDTEFDLKAVTALFPELQEKANIISGTNKTRVRMLHETLQAAASKGALPFQFFCITDLDSEVQTNGSVAQSYSWDVYHLENYLVDAKYICRAMDALKLTSSSEDETWEQIRACAQECLPLLVRHELSEFANIQLISQIKIGSNPQALKVANALVASIEASATRISTVINTELTMENLQQKERELTERHESDLANGQWVKTFRGRDILKRFAGKHGAGISYEVLRNLILSKMKDDNYKPVGMSNVIEKILATS